MWKKDQAPGAPGSKPMATPTPNDRVTESRGRRLESRGEPGQAAIGPSIAIRGDVTGEEDLLIRGRVEGKIDLKQHNVTVGKEGRVKADIFGHTVTIEGEVEGSVRGQEQITIMKSGRVVGNVTAPRVAIEEGATFQGSIDMGSPATPGTTGHTKPVSSTSSDGQGAGSVRSPESKPADAKNPSKADPAR